MAGLRDVKRIEVNASWESIKRYWFFYTSLMDVPDIVNLEDISDPVYPTYEQALSAGIDAVLKLIEKATQQHAYNAKLLYPHPSPDPEK